MGEALKGSDPLCDPDCSGLEENGLEIPGATAGVEEGPPKAPIGSRIVTGDDALLSRGVN